MLQALFNHRSVSSGVVARRASIGVYFSLIELQRLVDCARRGHVGHPSHYLLDGRRFGNSLRIDAPSKSSGGQAKLHRRICRLKLMGASASVKAAILVAPGDYAPWAD